jgi:cation diffusion facilitator CzcD-associated flavoprotein CzcO
VSSDKYVTHFSVYRTNLPKEFMSFPDFPFKEELDKFLSADEVLQYLHQYADAFNLRPLIKVITSINI